LRSTWLPRLEGVGRDLPHLLQRVAIDVGQHDVPGARRQLAFQHREDVAVLISLITTGTERCASSPLSTAKALMVLFATIQGLAATLFYTYRTLY
jgi:hypothetical protein